MATQRAQLAPEECEAAVPGAAAVLVAVAGVEEVEEVSGLEEGLLRLGVGF